MKKVLPFLLIGGGVLFAGMAFNTKQAVERLQYRNPRLRFRKITLSGIYLDMELDITNPASSSIPIEYFTGDIYYSGNKLSSFTFDGNKNNISIKARTTTRVPFTIVISSVGALQTLTKLYKALIAGTKIDTVMSVSAMMYAAGLDIPVNFSYDFKSNQVNGVEGIAGYKRKTTDQYELWTNYGYGWECETTEDTLAEIRQRKKEYLDNARDLRGIRIKKVRVKVTDQVNGIGSCKATLEFGSNAEMEKYFTGKRIEKKIMFSKN